MFSNNSRHRTRKRLLVRNIVVCFLICACFRGPICALAQNADHAEYAGSTTVKAYVSAEPVEETGQSYEIDENVETGDDNLLIFWMIMLVSSLTGLVCVWKARNAADNGYGG